MTSTVALSRRLCRSLLSNSKASHHHDILPVTYCTNNLSFRSVSDITESGIESDLYSELDSNSVTNQPSFSPSSSQSPTQSRKVYDRPLENGLDAGIFKVRWMMYRCFGTFDSRCFVAYIFILLTFRVCLKAILVGKVGQSPLQKQLKSGRTVTLLSVGTGGIRNNRRPLANEEPREYANRCAVQWHRVSIYPQRLGNIVMKHAVPG